MFWWDIGFAVIVAVVLAAIFGPGFRRTGPWAGVMFFFLIVFLATWAGGLWIAPFGPTVYGVAWIPFIFFGLFIALLLAASTPRRYRHNPSEGGDAPRTDESEAGRGADALVWVIFVFLLVAVILGYVIPKG